MEVDEDLVEDLRASLRRVGTDDSAERCVLMLALAVQLYYRSGSEPEVLALVDEGMAVARRLGDAGLLAWAAHAGWLALWRNAYLDRRRGLAREGVEAALASGDEAAEALARICLGGTAIEDGDLETWQQESTAAGAIARRRRLAYIEYVLHFVGLNLSLLAEQDDEADAHADAMRTMRETLATPALEWNEFGMLYATATWRPHVAEQLADTMVELFRNTPSDTELGRSPLLHVLALTGRDEELRAELDRAPLHPMSDTWYLTMEASVRAVVAGLLGDRALARQSVEPLRAASGRLTVIGISVVAGPVDGYLAVGLAVLGEAAEATELAERAATLADRWGMTAYLRWLREQRERLGF
jgi:hypothetical protein